MARRFNYMFVSFVLRGLEVAIMPHFENDEQNSGLALFLHLSNMAYPG